MKPLIFTLALLFSLNTYSQNHIKHFENDGDKIAMQRIPANELKSFAAKNIIEVQKELENFHSNYQNKERLQRRSSIDINTLMDVIDMKDSSFDLSYYKKELAFYVEYDEMLRQEERKQSQIAYERKEFVRDSTMRAKARERAAAKKN